jgi:hypothetical protein
MTPSAGAVNPRFGTPAVAIALVAIPTGAAAFLGDAVLVPISEVGTAVGAMGWCATCLAFIAAARRAGQNEGTLTAAIGVLVSVAIILMKMVPAVPGSLTGVEWLAFLGWCAVGAAVLLWRRARPSRPDPAPTSPSGRGR